MQHLYQLFFREAVPKANFIKYIVEGSSGYFSVVRYGDAVLAYWCSFTHSDVASPLSNNKVFQPLQ